MAFLEVLALLALARGVNAKAINLNNEQDKIADTRPLSMKKHNSSGISLQAINNELDWEKNATIRKILSLPPKTTENHGGLFSHILKGILSRLNWPLILVFVAVALCFFLICYFGCRKVHGFYTFNEVKIRPETPTSGRALSQEESQVSLLSQGDRTSVV